MDAIFTYLAIGVILGPVFAIPYALENNIDSFAAFMVLSLVYPLSVPIVYEILKKAGAKKRYRTKIMEDITYYMHKKGEDLVEDTDKFVSKFEENFGQRGFDIALFIITFIFGIYLAAIAAYVLRVDIKKAMIWVGAGTVVCIGFWWYVIATSTSIIDPIYFSLFFIAVIALSFAYERIEEKRAYERAYRFFKDVDNGIRKSIEVVSRGLKKDVNKK